MESLNNWSRIHKAHRSWNWDSTPGILDWTCIISRGKKIGQGHGLGGCPCVCVWGGGGFLSDDREFSDGNDLASSQKLNVPMRWALG